MNTSEWLNAWAEPWASFMSRSTIDSALVFGLVGLVWLVLHKRLSAQMGYLLFLLVLVKLILPGVISLPGLIHAWLPMSEAVTAGTGDGDGWWRFGRLRGGGDEAPVPAATPIGSIMEREEAESLSLGGWLMLGWAAAVAVMVVRFAEYQWFLRSWARRIRPVKGKAWHAEMEDLSRRAGLHQTVSWKTAFWVESPAVWGFRHPVILVPPGFTRRFSREQIRWILLHELAHIRRGDAWARLVQGVFQIAFFFNPVVLATNWIVDRLREYACDDVAIVAARISRQECSEGLLGISTQMYARPVLMPYALGLSRNGRFIGRRIMRILDEKRNIQMGLNWKSCAALIIFAALLLPIGGTVAVGEALGWVKMETKVSPSQRQGHGLAYDASHQRVVMFGGLRSTPRAMLNETWEWDGYQWKELNISPANRPEPRFLMPMVYDSIQKKIVMYGGADADKWKSYEDTWEFDGQQWFKLNAEGPGLRYGHAMAFDEAREKILLFGGHDNNMKELGDLWEWDGTRWSRLEVSGLPSPRAVPYMAYDRDRETVVLFGGWNGTKALGDTWEWDGTRFQKVSETGPEPRLWGSMAYSNALQRIVLFGGCDKLENEISYSDTWKYDGDNWSRLNVAGPNARHIFSMAYDSHREKIVLFGGFGSITRGDIYLLYDDTWELGLVISGLKTDLWSKY
ncbi:MAG: M56 family metallopeptidase [bacterium]